MQTCGNDYLFIENFDGSVSSPESLCVSLCQMHFGVGADGIVLMEPSDVADVKMRSFNRDGSEGRMAGNNLRCVAKYLYDKGLAAQETLRIETASGVREAELFVRDGKVSSVTVDMGKPSFRAGDVPARWDGEEMVDVPAEIGGEAWRVTCLSVGNPHCVVFCDSIDHLDLETLGPAFAFSPLYPERVNVEFVRVVDRYNLRLRVWERGIGETLACGTGACAAAAAAARFGLCAEKGEVTASLLGGELTVGLSGESIRLTGSAVKVFEGCFEY